MVYAVIQISDGNFIVKAEGFTDITKARVSYHDVCKNLYAAIASINEFTVMIMNSGGGVVEIESYVKPIEEMDEPVIEDIPAEDIPAEVEV